MTTAWTLINKGTDGEKVCKLHQKWVDKVHMHFEFKYQILLLIKICLLTLYVMVGEQHDVICLKKCFWIINMQYVIV